ncbi:MAG TPA: FAD-dependent oxidoreductase [Ideonella sp.]|nr:FAD-dependent oxidoreductase [Ideonella sp.]
MHIAVIGAGIVGVMTAYELALDGHEVSVFERRSSIAAEASFGHAGLISPGYPMLWGAPPAAGGAGARRLGRWFGSRSGTADSQETIGRRLHRLVHYSRERLRAIEQALQLGYEQQAGLLVLLRDKRELVAARAGLKLLAELGERFHLIDAAQARALEPGLNPEMALHAAVHLADDTVANGRLFAQLIKAEAQRLGVRFLFDHEVQRVVAGTAPQVHARAPADADPPPARLDAVVLCAALGAGALLAPLGLKLPLAASYGYSVTAPLQMREHAFDEGPRVALVDPRHQVSISRLGDRVRVAGGAEADGPPERMNPEALSLLYTVLEDWFPGAAQTVRAQEWKGCRAALPGGVPVLGASGHAGVWLNLGHGAQGWALACGSARIVADQIAQRSPGTDTEGLGVERLR